MEISGVLILVYLLFFCTLASSCMVVLNSLKLSNFTRKSAEQEFDKISQVFDDGLEDESIKVPSPDDMYKLFIISLSALPITLSLLCRIGVTEARAYSTVSTINLIVDSLRKELNSMDLIVDINGSNNEENLITCNEICNDILLVLADILRQYNFSIEIFALRQNIIEIQFILNKFIKKEG